MKSFIFALALLSFTLVACESGKTETPVSDSTSVSTTVTTPDSTSGK